MLKRRDFLRLSCALPAGVAFSSLAGTAAVATTSERWRTFELRYDIHLKGEGPARLWLPVPMTADGYQHLLAHAWDGNARRVSLTREPVYGAASAYAEWPAAAGERQLGLSLRVATRNRAVDPRGRTAARAENLALYLRPTPHMPNDGIVAETARRITHGLKDPLDRAYAIYEWIVDNTFRDPKIEGCGMGDIRGMLVTGNLGGKCADINALFVGLARAADIPSREVYGIRVTDSDQFRSLGKSGDVSKAQHCRAEFHLAGAGWVPVDAADVRKAVLEEKLPLADARIRALRERLFGYWEMNWVGYNRARDFALVPRPEAALNYFMYPYAETAAGRAFGLHPDRFTYRIIAHEVAA